MMTISCRWRYTAAILVLWLAFGLRLYRIDSQSIWWDEGHSIFVASHSMAQIPTLPAMDVHPPAYFMLLRQWMSFTGNSEFALRYLSTTFSLLTVALLWRLAAAITRTLRYGYSETILAALFTALLAAVSPLYVAYGQEVRSYAMITFLALASTFSLWCFLFVATKRDSSKSFPIYRSRPGLLTIYVVLSAICFYTHYFTIFLLLFQNLIWFIWVLFSTQSSMPNAEPLANKSSSATGLKRRAKIIDRVKLWSVSQAGILLLFTPQLLLAWQQVTSYTNPNLISPSLTYFIGRSWQAYTIGLTIDPAQAWWSMGIVGLIVITSWLAQLIITRSKAPVRLPNLIFLVTFLGAWLLVPLGCYFLVLQRQPSFEPRYLILVTPALFLLLVFGLSGISAASPQSGKMTPLTIPTPYYVSGSILLILIGIFNLGLYNYYTNETYFKDDSASVAEWLAAETTPDDIVYVDVPHPFHYYAESAGIAAPTRYLFVDIHTAAETLNQEAAGRNRLFWVTWQGSDTDPRGVIPFLAEKAGEQTGEHQFRGYRVTQFDLPETSPVFFSLPNQLNPIEVFFGDVLRLDGVAFGGQQDRTTTINEPVWATLHFSLLRKSEVNYKVSLRLRDDDKRVIAQVDRDLLNDRHFRTMAWPPDDPALNQAINVYMLPLPPDTPPGNYQLEVVVYNGEPPYPSEGVTGHQTENGGAAILGHLKIVAS